VRPRHTGSLADRRTLRAGQPHRARTIARLRGLLAVRSRRVHAAEPVIARTPPRALSTHQPHACCTRSRPRNRPIPPARLWARCETDVVYGAETRAGADARSQGPTGDTPGLADTISHDAVDHSRDRSAPLAAAPGRRGGNQLDACSSPDLRLAPRAAVTRPSMTPRGCLAPEVSQPSSSTNRSGTRRSRTALLADPWTAVDGPAKPAAAT
jgi:hypothetical protein